MFFESSTLIELSIFIWGSLNVRDFFSPILPLKKSASFIFFVLFESSPYILGISIRLFFWDITKLVLLFPNSGPTSKLIRYESVSDILLVSPVLFSTSSFSASHAPKFPESSKDDRSCWVFNLIGLMTLSLILLTYAWGFFLNFKASPLLLFFNAVENVKCCVLSLF